MKSLAAALAAGLAFAASGSAANAQISDDVVKIGVLTDMSSLYADATGKGSLAAVADGGRRLRRQGQRQAVEVLVAATTRTSPMSASTSPATGIDNEKVDAIFDVPTSSVALPISALTPREEQDQHQFRRRQLRHHRRRLLAQHRALDLRHLFAVQCRRQGDGQARRGHLVLRHRRLRLRHGAGARRRQCGQGNRRQGARRRPPSAQHRPTSRRSCCRRRPPRPRSSALANAGGDTTNALKQAAEFGMTQGRPEADRAAAGDHRRACARLQGDPGPDRHRRVLLGHERRDPRLLEPLPTRKVGTCRP